MHVVISAATKGEWTPASLAINPLYTGPDSRCKVSFHQAGVGMLTSAFALSKLIYEEKPDLVIQAGIAGCFMPSQPLTTVLAVNSEILGDTGVQEAGIWKDLFDLALEEANHPPFEQKQLPNPWLQQYNLLQLPEVSAVTVNTISTDQQQIQQLVKKYNPVLESMEGASLHYVCRQTHTPFLQIRSTSNYVGERDKSQWRIRESIDLLNQTLLTYIDQLYKAQ